MKKLGFTMVVLLLGAVVLGQGYCHTDRGSYVMTSTDLKGYEVRMYWRDTAGVLYGGFDGAFAADTNLVALCNGGMFMEGYIPLGLYIEGGKVLRPVNRRSGGTNFYIEPNGIFLVDDWDSCAIIRTDEYEGVAGIRYATQSGPILVEDSIINSRFIEKSNSTNRRNGIGIRADGSVVMIISLRFVNFHDFAGFFLAEGCVDALYLDGCISGLWTGEDDYGYTDEFGVMIGISKEDKP